MPGFAACHAGSPPRDLVSRETLPRRARSEEITRRAEIARAADVLADAAAAYIAKGTTNRWWALAAAHDAYRQARQ